MMGRPARRAVARIVHLVFCIRSLPQKSTESPTSYNFRSAPVAVQFAAGHRVDATGKIGTAKTPEPLALVAFETVRDEGALLRPVTGFQTARRAGSAS